MLRLIHNRVIVKYFLAGLGLAFAVFYGFCFYAFGDWAGHTFLQDIPAGAQVLGWICFALMFGLVFVALFSKEYMKQNARAYSNITGDQSFYQAFTAFSLFVIGMELTSVLFRVTMLGFTRLSWVVLAAGLAGMALVFIISKLMHSEMNRPAAVAAAQLREEAQRQVFDDGRKHLRGLSIGEKRRVGMGDPTPIDDVRDAKAQEREEAVREDARRQKQAELEEAERQRVVDEERQRNQEFYEQMVAPPRGKTNGKQPANF